MRLPAASRSNGVPRHLGSVEADAPASPATTAFERGWLSKDFGGLSFGEPHRAFGVGRGRPSALWKRQSITSSAGWATIAVVGNPISFAARVAG